MRHVLSVCLLMSLCSTAWGFGQNGHRIVAHIADTHLTPAARAAVAKILNNQSMAAASTWPDEMRSSPDRRYWDKASVWHYINIPPGKTYATATKHPGGNAYTHLSGSIALLRKSRASAEEQAAALKWIIHLVGDLHQPLHVGYASDRGGNDVKVTWFGKPSNLHRVWDTDLIEYENLSYTEYAAFISNFSTDQTSQWQKASIEDWIDEGLVLRKQIYGQKNRKLGYQYTFDFAPTIKSQLAKAGVRLAGILNQIYR